MKKENGQSLVEFALVLPILLILVFSIIDFGMLFSAKNDLEITSFATARAISLGKLDPLPSGVSVTPPVYQVGDKVQVKVTVLSYTGKTPIIQLFFGSNYVTLTSTTNIVIEQKPT